jgi:hypothetical protein
MTDNKHHTWKSKITDNNPKTLPIRSFGTNRYKYEILFETGSYDIPEAELETLKFLLDGNFNYFMKNILK